MTKFAGAGGSATLRVVASIAAATIVLAGCATGSGAPSASTGPASAPVEPSALPSTVPATGGPTERPVATPSPTASPSPEPLSITSPAFAPGAKIPAEYTCRGADESPALAWSGVPAGTNALVLFVDDPDGGNWVHWSVLDIAPSIAGLPRGVKPSDDALQQGTNDFGRLGYGGPCPPSGTHRYRFTLYALGAPLGLRGQPKGSAVRSALATADVIASDTLVGTVAH